MKSSFIFINKKIKYENTAMMTKEGNNIVLRGSNFAQIDVS